MRRFFRVMQAIVTFILLTTMEAQIVTFTTFSFVAVLLMIFGLSLIIAFS